MEQASKSIEGVSFVNKLPLDPQRSTLPVILTGDRVLIDPISREDESLSDKIRLDRPVTFKDDWMEGRIMNIGAGEYGTDIPVCLKLGVIVRYYHQAKIDFISSDKKTYHMVRASDVFMIL